MYDEYSLIKKEIHLIKLKILDIRNILDAQLLHTKAKEIKKQCVEANKKNRDGILFSKYKKEIELLSEEIINKIEELKFEKLKEKNSNPVVLNYYSEQIFRKEYFRIVDICKSMGFTYYDFPIIDTRYCNFEFLNMPADFVDHKSISVVEDKNYVLRSHTTQIWSKIKSEYNDFKDSFRVFQIGKVFRNETDATHFPCFHQIDLFFKQSNENCTTLLNTIKEFLFCFFESQDIKIEIKLSHFPFTSPSFELYIKNLEVAGCGIVSNDIVDHKLGCIGACGIGVERIIMIKNGIKDIRGLWS